MATIETALGALHVLEQGSGPPLFFWHSLLCDGDMWRAQVDELSRDHRCIVVDGPGHGRSGPPRGPFTLEGCADAALQVLDELGVREPTVFLGLSWGGMTAMRVALRNPTRVRALVLMDTNANPDTFFTLLKYRFLTWIFRRWGFVPWLLEKPTLEAMFGETTRRTRPELGRQLVDKLAIWDNRALALASSAVVLKRTPIIHRLGEIRVPTLVIVGEEDTATTPEVNEQIAKLIPGARLERIPKAGHLTAIEAPDAVNRLVCEFLAGVEGSQDQGRAVGASSPSGSETTNPAPRSQSTSSSK